MKYDTLHAVLVTVGVSEAIDLALRAILNPGDEVLYHEPCYVSYAPVSYTHLKFYVHCITSTVTGDSSPLERWRIGRTS